MRRTLELAHYDALHAEQARLRAAGRYRGIGVSIYVEGVGLGPFEGALTRLDSRGKVIVTLAAPPQGQGYQTAFAQIAADALGVRLADVEVVTGDTASIPFGIGTFASRVMANAGPSVFQAGQALRQKLLAVAAHLLEAAPDDVESVDGRVRVRGFSGRSIGLAEVAPNVNVGRHTHPGPESGYVLEGEDRVYFAGDTDLFPGMADIASGLDLAILPIGGWGPTLRSGHLDPTTAASALRLLQPRAAVAVLCRAWRRGHLHALPLAADPGPQPRRLLQGVPPQQLGRRRDLAAPTDLRCCRAVARAARSTGADVGGPAPAPSMG